MRPEALANPKSRALRFKLWVIAKIMRLDQAPEPLRFFLARAQDCQFNQCHDEAYEETRIILVCRRPGTHGYSRIRSLSMPFLN